MLFKRCMFIAIVLAALRVSNGYSQNAPAINQRQLRPHFDSSYLKASIPGRIKLDAVQNTDTTHWVALKDWNQCNVVVAENDSIVWVGTPVGLVRWDITDHTYKTFDGSNGLLFTGINDLAFDRNKNLWIATSQGVVEYVSGHFTAYNYTNSNLPDAPFTHIAVDSSGKVYATYDWFVLNNNFVDGGLAVFDGTGWTYRNISNTGGTFGPTGVLTYHDTVWVAATDSFYTFVGSVLRPAPGWSNIGIFSMAIDYQDSLWVQSTNMKTIKYSGGQWRVMIDDEKEGIGQIWDHIWNDPRGGLWLSNPSGWYVPDQTLYRLDFQKEAAGESCAFGMPPGVCPVNGLNVQFNYQYAVSPDEQFFATRWGLLEFNGTSWISFTVPKTLLSNLIYSLGASPAGEMYISGEMATQRTDGPTWSTVGGMGWLNPPVRFQPDSTYWNNGIDGHYATGLDFDSYGTEWAAYGDVYSYNSSGLKDYPSSDMGITWPSWSRGPQFMDISVDRNDDIWACAWYYGAVMYDRTHWHPFPISDSTLPNFGYDRIFTDSHGRVWFASWGMPNYGFTVLDSSKWATYYSPTNFQISFVNQFAEDQFGNVWLATSGGLLKYDGKSFTLFDNSNTPMSSNSVNAVAVDPANNIWIGTTAGLYVYNPSGVKLGPYNFSNAADSLSVRKTGVGTVVTFNPKPANGDSCMYELQRGRTDARFWTVAATPFTSDPAKVMQLHDSTAVSGGYCYRIKRVDKNGSVAYSGNVQYLAGQSKVQLLNCSTYSVVNVLFMKWRIESDPSVVGFEVWRGDSSLVSRVSSTIQSASNGYFSAPIDSLQASAKVTEYTLYAVLADSSRQMLTKVSATPAFPAGFYVSNNYPNPFNGFTTLEIYTPSSIDMQIRIYDILGRKVMPVISEHLDKGFQAIHLNLGSLASGVYLYQIESKGKRVNGKLILLK